MLKYIEHKTRRFMKIADGIFVGKKDGKEIYNTVTGRLTGISLEEFEYENEYIRRWHITMDDADEMYDISFPLNSRPFISLVRFLASDRGLQNLDNLEIHVYLTEDGYTNVRVEGGGQRLDWTPEVMPSVKVVRVKDEDVIDNAEQMAWIEGLVKRINTKLSHRFESMPTYVDSDEKPRAKC